MQEQIRLLQYAERILPINIFEDEICKRIHKTQMFDVFLEMKDIICEKADMKVKECAGMLQAAYHENFIGLFHILRYELNYYDAIETGNGLDDHYSCQVRADNWDMEDEDYFSVYHDLPLLEEDFELDEYWNYEEMDMDDLDY
jgi:hypothetical protein